MELDGQTAFRQSTHIRRLGVDAGTALLQHVLIKIAFLDGWRSVLAGAHEKDFFGRLEQNLNRLALERGSLRLTIPMACIEGEKVA